MNVLFAASEARPFIASGGLADVIGALPKALTGAGCDCRVILPLYSDIPDKFREEMKEKAVFKTWLGWRNLYCGLLSMEYNGVTFYFVDNEYYFKRSGIYGHFDDGERFAFFSMAVLEAVKHMDFTPDVIHCHDWQTGLIPTFKALFYSDEEKLRNAKTIFTIHNIQYQGNYDMYFAADVLGIPENKRGIVEYDGRCNFMKAGIDQCDAISTVSPTYAQEIQDPWFAWGLDRLLRERKYKLAGILNGIDTESYDPCTDKDIPVTFSKYDLAGKAKCKEELQKELGLEVDPNAMVIGMVGRLVSHKGLDLVRAACDRILEMPVQIAVLGSGESAFESFFRYMQEKYPGRVSFVCGFIPPLARRIYAGSDVFLMPSKSEPCGLAQMISLRYGTVPIVRETGGLKDSIKDVGGLKGNGFTFQTYNAEDMLDAVRRAHDLYRKGERWKETVLNALSCDFSWSRSAHAYTRLYEAVLGRKG
ncbi:MAG: glycogen synthase GlgA [Oscillospiraceae bacterium]|nr:glycogen synthase GlgA [Oscillospiraceae bacterium]MBQ2997969.1 glycogen synthase GlgA [Oscillospiraceae bacterium]MBQ4118145.1 glycogen synthase GlgA [Oscillospiraceae bacterium]